MTRRLPNPWIAAPVALGALVGGLIGWSVTAVGCNPDACPGLAGLVAAVAGLLTAAGVGTVAVLAVRSLSEWREANSSGEGPPGDE